MKSSPDFSNHSEGPRIYQNSSLLRGLDWLVRIVNLSYQTLRVKRGSYEKLVLFYES